MKQRAIDFCFPVLEHRVTDGDTVHVKLDMGWNVTYQAACRILGVDTPEKNTDAGKLVRQVVERWCKEQAELRCCSVHKDKYGGRFLGDLFPREDVHQSLSAFLVREGLAKFYDGGTKDVWKDPELKAAETKCREILSTPPAGPAQPHVARSE